MNAVTLHERMQATRRRQAQALAGEFKSPARRTVAANDDPSSVRAQAAAPSRTWDVVVLPRAGQLREFELLLPAAAKHYGYSEQDVAAVRASVAADTSGSNRELALCIRQWRIDLVANGLDAGLPGEVANRARTQFRQDVMCEATDECGSVYTDKDLEFVPAAWEQMDTAPAPKRTARP